MVVLIPIFLVPMLLAGERVLLFVSIERHKIEFAAPGKNWSSDDIRSLQRQRALASSPWVLMSCLAVSVVPAVLQTALQERYYPDSWIVADPLDSNSTICVIYPAMGMGLAYFSVFALWFIAGYFRLRRARENFGIMNLYRFTLLGACFFVSPWIPLTYFGIPESHYFALLTTAQWPFFSVFWFLRDKYLTWSPSSALVLDAKTHQSIKMRSWSSNSSQLHRQSERVSSIANSSSPDLSLEALLADQGLKTDFEHFLQAEFSSENLHFLQAVGTYRRNPSQDAAVRLFTLYIADTAPLQVNISNHAKKRLEDFCSGAQAKDAPVAQDQTHLGELRDLFEEAEGEILRLLEFDSLRRFTVSRNTPSSRTSPAARSSGSLV
eukprot:TRINITY_DN5249_c0_g1_i8.p1 TRINITY_DN5249_c0_g1~~TRINITY_DN5249_c0_g1_i8.p1  ORF type:complete len:379 (+),score=74.31 TRINITY_DN5249_c0_g1_i8:282-1418(+)